MTPVDLRFRFLVPVRRFATAFAIASIAATIALVPVGVAVASPAPHVAPIPGLSAESISCPSISTCYALVLTGTTGDLMGEQAEVLATTNGGSSWQVQNFSYTFGPYGASYLHITCPTTTACYAELSGLSTSTSFATDLIATNDGGGTWRTLPSPLPAGAPGEGMSCPSATTCFLADGSGVWVTEDGGDTWVQAYVGQSTDISCVSPTWCGLTGGDGMGIVYYSPVWGLTGVPYPRPVYQDGVVCASMIACITYNGAFSPVTAPAAFVTWDNGLAWVTFASKLPPQTTAFNHLTCPGTTVCYAVGSVGSTPAVFRSDDRGANFVALPLPSPVTPTGISCPTLSLCFVSATESGVAVYLVTTNGGASFTTRQFSSAPTSAAPVPMPSPVVGAARTADGRGYWLARADGTVLPFGDAAGFGDLAGQHLNAPIVSMAMSGAGQGYWLLGADGGVFSFGAAHFYGSTGSVRLNQPVVAMAATPSGNGYWFVAADGGVFSYGDAHFYGSTGSMRLNQPVVGMTATADGRGYYLVARDGGIFTFGDAIFRGSTGNLHLNRPIVGMARDGNSYWLVAADGGVFAFDAPFFGSAGNLHLAAPIVGMTNALSPYGYRIVASDGGVFTYGDAQFYGTERG